MIKVTLQHNFRALGHRQVGD